MNNNIKIPTILIETGCGQLTLLHLTINSVCVTRNISWRLKETFETGITNLPGSLKCQTFSLTATNRILMSHNDYSRNKSVLN